VRHVRVAALALGALALVAGARTAAAYPQFQLSMGADRCQMCHFSPAGGGLLNDYGRDEAGDDISGAGDGRFLYGAWTPPSWLALGVDLRAAGGVKDTPGSTYPLGFPMQADVYTRFGAARGLSFTMTVGLRGAARPPAPSVLDMLASREHYLMYQRGTWYARAGRFFPIFGIRTQDHTAYIRKFLDLGTLQEPYGAAFGWFGATSETHVSLFGPDPSPRLGAAPDDYGGAVYHERRVGDAAAWAAQARVLAGPDERRFMAGGVGKLWLPGSRVMLLGELDAGAQTFVHGGPARGQVAAYAGASWLPRPGWMLGAVAQLWEPDVAVHGTSRAATELDAQWFFRAHWEAHLLGRVEAQGLHVGHPDSLVLLQLHYYL
jgi:hypothetical protein